MKTKQDILDELHDRYTTEELLLLFGEPEDSQQPEQKGTEMGKLLKAAYRWGRDNGEGRSEKNLNDFMQTSLVKSHLTSEPTMSQPTVKEIDQCIHDICVLEERIILYRDKHRPNERTRNEVYKLQDRQREAIRNLTQSMSQLPTDAEIRKLAEKEYPHNMLVTETVTNAERRGYEQGYIDATHDLIKQGRKEK